MAGSFVDEDGSEGRVSSESQIADTHRGVLGGIDKNGPRTICDRRSDAVPSIACGVKLTYWDGMLYAHDHSGD